MNKCDNLSLEIKRLKNENKIMKEHYEKIIKEKDEKIAKLEIKNDRLRKHKKAIK